MIAKSFASIHSFSSRQNSSRLIGARAVPILIFFLGLLIYSMQISSYALPIFGSEEFEWYITGLGAAMMIGGLIGSPTARKVFSMPPLVYLGKISYSVYLVHVLVLKAITPLVLIGLSKFVILEGSNWGFLAFFSINVSIVILISDVLYRFVEAPSIRFAKWIHNFKSPIRL